MILSRPLWALRVEMMVCWSAWRGDWCRSFCLELL
jgi:hypothetical protein